jgi:hypothetical protein
MITSAIILGGIVATYFVGGQFVVKDGATKAAWHWTWPKTVFNNIRKAL